MAELILYHTSDCHLCERAQALLMSAGCTVTPIDIVADDELLERYGTRIPVLRNSRTRRELDWPFDEADILAFFRG